MYIDENCNICASCVHYAGNTCALLGKELKELVGTYCDFFMEENEMEEDK